MSAATPEEVRSLLERLLTSEALSKSGTNRRLLSYLVQRSLQGGESPKEAEIAIDVFSRDARFNGGEDSVVRVSMRGLRQKLIEYYAGPGRDDPLVLDIPKGGYRLTVTARENLPADAFANPTAAAEEALPPTDTLEAPPSSPRGWQRPGLALALALLLLASMLLNLSQWHRDPARDPHNAWLQHSQLWGEVVSSERPVMFVLGDLFMYTQTDPQTGRTQTVRDTAINSSEDLRSFLASNPALAAERGLRYSMMVQKSAALGMAEILPLVAQPGRRVDVKVREELTADDIHTHDIIYVGPLTRLGALASHFHVHSRYRFDEPSSGITDVESGKTYTPEGELGAHHRDFALAAKFPGPAGNSIILLTSGGRNAGLLQIIKTLTGTAGLRALDQKIAAVAGPEPQAFEALLSVTGFKQTALGAEVLDVHILRQGATPIR